jgi:CheY-like chemotaxis protein
MPSILVVEDCVEVAGILSRHLTSAGHVVTVAHNGIEALDLIAAGRVPDCIVLDLMMPVMTGLEVLHVLKGRVATARIPVVLVSSRVGTGRTHIVAERDADHCVGKPFTKRQVLDAVAAALAGSAKTLAA